MKSNMNRRSLDPKGEHVSPLGNGRIDRGFQNLEVRCLWWPEEKAFKQLVYKAITATRGNELTDANVDEVLVNEAFSGGLNQCLEWVTVVFECNGVSRGLTHELVRTRKASYAQQSMRHTDMGNAAMRMPVEIAQGPLDVRIMWLDSIIRSRDAYMTLTAADVPFQDARTVLPIATETYIMAEYPLSEFIGTYAYRACYMFYPEIVALFGLMKAALVEKCPWLADKVLISCEKTRPNATTGQAHMCTYQGWERVEGQCPFAWAREDNRVWKSTRFES